MITLIVSCTGNKPTSPAFSQFDFSYNDTWNSSFSLKITQEAGVYIRQRFVSDRYSKADTTMQSNTSYAGSLPEAEWNQFNTLVRAIDFSGYDTAYIQDGLQDGLSCKFYIETNGVARSIHLYGDSTPPELAQLARWIADTKMGLRLTRIDTTVTFNSYLHFEPPPMVLDTRRFTPPVVEQ